MSYRLQVDHTLESHEMLPALLALAYAEDVAEPLAKAIDDAQSSREPIPEKWMGDLIGEFCAAGKRLDDLMIANVHKLILTDLSEPIAKAFKPSRLASWTPGRQRPARLLLTQSQVDELIALVRSHYRIMIRAGDASAWSIDAAAERRWKALGILRPDVQLADKIGDAFIAGRMAQILDDGASIGDMRRMALEFPLSREAALTMQAVQDRVAFDLSGGVGYRAEQQAGRLVLGQNAERVQQIVSAYRSGQLKRTPTNRRGLSPEEMDVIGEAPAMAGWRGLGRELRNRMAGEDRDRDWERVAATSLRQSANTGAIQAMAEAGVEELWYDVHPRACAHCKELYLEPNGQPRIFTIGEIMENLATTGGANYGRRASKIGDPDLGWLPTAAAHPWCMCRPKRRLKNVKPSGRINANDAQKRS